MVIKSQNYNSAFICFNRYYNISSPTQHSANSCSIGYGLQLRKRFGYESRYFLFCIINIILLSAWLPTTHSAFHRVPDIFQIKRNCTPVPLNIGYGLYDSCDTLGISFHDYNEGAHLLNAPPFSIYENTIHWYIPMETVTQCYYPVTYVSTNYSLIQNHLFKNTCFSYADITPPYCGSFRVTTNLPGIVYYSFHPEPKGVPIYQPAWIPLSSSCSPDVFGLPCKPPIIYHAGFTSLTPFMMTSSVLYDRVKKIIIAPTTPQISVNHFEVDPSNYPLVQYCRRFMQHGVVLSTWTYDEEHAAFAECFLSKEVQTPRITIPNVPYSCDQNITYSAGITSYQDNTVAFRSLCYSYEVPIYAETPSGHIPSWVIDIFKSILSHSGHVFNQVVLAVYYIIRSLFTLIDEQFQVFRRVVFYLLINQVFKSPLFSSLVLLYYEFPLALHLVLRSGL